MDIYNNYCPSPIQQQFHDCNAKFKALITGVGFGKTAAGANEIIKTALEYPKSKHLILAPTSKIMNFATLVEFWKWCPKEIVQAHLKSKQTIYLKGGAQIIYLTADNERHVDRLRGIEIGSCWPDEARLFPAYVWEVLLTRLRDKYGPLKIFPTTTPKGYNWIYYYFVKKQHPITRKSFPNKDEYVYFTGTTADNPHTPEEYKQNLQNQLSGQFLKQEFYGLFTSFSGQVYNLFKHHVHIINKYDPNRIKEIIVGLDWGFSNPCAILIIGLDSDNRAYVLEEYYKQRKDIDVIGEWLLKKKEQYGFTNVYADPSEPMLISKLNNMGLTVLKANNEVMPGINFTYNLFEVQKDGKPRIFIMENCTNLVDEINAYSYAERKEDKEAKEEPIKVNDHACDAMRYALFTHLRSRGEFKVLKDIWS